MFWDYGVQFVIKRQLEDIRDVESLHDCMCSILMLEMLISPDFSMWGETIQIVFSRPCGSAHSFDLEVSEQHTLEFSEWESQDYCIYH